MKTPFSSNKPNPNGTNKGTSEAWKSKYYSLLKELEQQENHCSEIESVLRRSLSRMTALGIGQNKELDTYLHRLRNIIHDQAPADHLGRLVDEIINLSEPVDSTHPDNPDSSTTDSATEAHAVLDSDHSRQLLVLLLEISALANQDASRHTQWQDWQHQLQQPTTALPSLATEIIHELTVRPITQADLYDVTADALRSLLEQLPLPDSLHVVVTTIRQQLNSGLDHVSLAETVSGIVDLARAAQQDLEQQRHELERFLIALTQRLQEMDQLLADSSEHSQQGLQNAQEMNQAVQSEMASINNQVETAEELGQLKQIVQHHLMRIEKRLNDHIEIEVDQDQKHRRHIEQLVSRLGKMEDETRHLRLRVSEERARALTDKLTGVNNRLAFDERLEQELTRWKRYKTPLSLVFWDIDHFKRINDRLGHRAGDKILQALGSLLKKRLRESDFTARFGGEEFISLLPEELHAAAKVADEIRAAIAGFKFNYQGERVPVSISCGVAECREGDTPTTLVERADRALYEAKEGGRNRCELAI